MPNRILRDAILTSERVASLAWPEEVFYRRLMSIADDYGRTEAGAQLLRAKCYPLQTDQVRAADISRWMAACQKSGLILCYEVGPKQYLEIVNFGQQQRSASKCPAPTAEDIKRYQETANAHLGVSVFVSEDVVARATRCPPDFDPKPEPDAERGIDRQTELANFRDYWTAKPGKEGLKLDWQATWRQWARKAHRKPADVARMTVPGKPGRDPELIRLETEAAKAVPMPAHLRKAA